MAKRERMSSVDTAWLRMDRPTNLMMIVGVMIFDTPIDYPRLRRVLETRFLKYDRFRQRIADEASGYSWEDDQDFDLDAHLQRAALPGAGGKEELEKLVAQLVSAPLNPNRPLWHFLLIENYQGGAAIVVRIHHCIADGIALIGVMLSMTDEGAEAPAETAPDAKQPENAEADESVWQQFFEPISDVVADAVKLSGTLARDLSQNPERISDYAKTGASVAREVAQLAMMPSDSATRFKGKPGTVKRVAWAEPIPLAEIKAVGKFLGCSVNDIMLSSAAGALRSYLLAQGDPVAGVEVRALVPVNLRTTGKEHKLGNRFGLVALVLPVGEENPLVRLYEVRRRMEELKGSYQAALTLGILGLVGMCPKPVQTQILDLLARKATAVMTNVPGPQKTLYLAGARLKQQMFWVPQSGDIGMGVSILSYDGRVQFGLVTDRRFVPDPERIVACFQPEFEKILYAVLMEPRRSREHPRTAGQVLSDPTQAGTVSRRAAGKPRRSPARKRSDNEPMVSETPAREQPAAVPSPEPKAVRIPKRFR
jgi:WS/DGAT/MGAT family acyltransferase